MKIALILLASLLAMSHARADTSSERAAMLDGYVERKKYDDVFRALFPKKAAPQLSAEQVEGDIEWLRARAETGEFPLMYFLSWQLMDRNPSEARKWNARGRVGVMLDTEHCANLSCGS